MNLRFKIKKEREKIKESLINLSRISQFNYMECDDLELVEDIGKLRDNVICAIDKFKDIEKFYESKSRKPYTWRDK
jgi:hypothetical protein